MNHLALRVRGFSLLELLVAVCCTTMIAAAVLSLLVTVAGLNRREWGRLAAGHAAAAAVAAVATDLDRAGSGLEGALAVRRGGVRIDYASSPGSTTLRLVLPLAAAVEIATWPGVSRYGVDAAGTLRPGDTIAAIGLASQPPGEPLPLGTVAAVVPVGVGAAEEIHVAWFAPEAALVSAVGPPRALLPVTLREYELRSDAGARQLVRRDDGGLRQPVADELESWRIVWLIDSDGDGHGDAEIEGAWSGPAAARCAARVEAAAVAVTTLSSDFPMPPAPASTAARWVTLAGC